MISNEEIERHLNEFDDIEFVQVKGDGYHYQVVVVSDAFEGKSKVARQQWVYAKLKTLITSGALHALSMQTWTKDEWENKHG